MKPKTIGDIVTITDGCWLQIDDINNPDDIIGIDEEEKDRLILECNYRLSVAKANIKADSYANMPTIVKKSLQIHEGFSIKEDGRFVNFDTIRVYYTGLAVRQLYYGISVPEMGIINRVPYSYITLYSGRCGPRSKEYLFLERYIEDIRYVI